MSSDNLNSLSSNPQTFSMEGSNAGKWHESRFTLLALIVTSVAIAKKVSPKLRVHMIQCSVSTVPTKICKTPFLAHIRYLYLLELSSNYLISKSFCRWHNATGVHFLTCQTVAFRRHVENEHVYTTTSLKAISTTWASFNWPSDHFVEAALHTRGSACSPTYTWRVDKSCGVSAHTLGCSACTVHLPSAGSCQRNINVWWAAICCSGPRDIKHKPSAQ